MSKQKENFILLLQQSGAVSEYRFHDKRLWRFDFAFPDLKIAFEYEGVGGVRSRHVSLVGYSNDCEKYNEAQRLGWRVYRFTALMIQDGRFVDFLGSLKIDII